MSVVTAISLSALAIALGTTGWTLVEGLARSLPRDTEDVVRRNGPPPVAVLPRIGKLRRPPTKSGKSLLALLLLPVLLMRCLTRNGKLSRWFVQQAVRFIPIDQHERYYREWLANIEHLEQYGLPTLGVSITLLRAGARIGGRQRAELAGVRTKQRALRLGPVWVGLLTFLGSFLIALSSLLVATSSPTKPQLGTAVVGSILLGVVAGDQARKARSEDRKA